MDHSPLAKLPPELRNRIYADALLQPNGIILRADSSKVTTSNNALVALTTVCRQLRAETEMMFYSINHFVIRTDVLQRISRYGFESWRHAAAYALAKSKRVQKWLTGLGSERRGQLQDLTWDLGYDDRRARGSEKVWWQDFPQYWPHGCKRVIAPVCKALGSRILKIEFALRCSCPNSRPARQALETDRPLKCTVSLQGLGDRAA